MNLANGVQDAGASRPQLHQCALRGLFQWNADVVRLTVSKADIFWAKVEVYFRSIVGRTLVLGSCAVDAAGPHQAAPSGTSSRLLSRPTDGTAKATS